MDSKELIGWVGFRGVCRMGLNSEELVGRVRFRGVGRIGWIQRSW